jgi:hypothetical protein
VYWDTSRDGSSWTNVWSVTDATLGFSLAALYIGFVAGYNGTESASNFTIANVDNAVSVNAASSPAAVTGLVKGIAAGGDIQNSGGTTTTQSQMNLIGSSLGAAWVRFDCNQEQIDPTHSGSYNWSICDTAVTDAQAAGLQVLLMVGEPSSATPYAQYSTFFAAAVARYYPRGVTAFEVMNEVNTGSNWGGTANATQSSKPATRLPRRSSRIASSSQRVSHRT